MMKKDIEDSLKVKTVYKLFEYLDDYSWNFKEKSILIEKVPESNKIYFYLFQEDLVQKIFQLLEKYLNGIDQENQKR